MSEYKYMCSDPGQEIIRRDIEEHRLTRVVVASCSPLMHETTFRKACDEAGLNPFLFQMANIREHCSWVHTNRQQATAKAKRLVTAAVQRVRHHLPLEEREVPVRPETLIVGGGIAGIEAALRIADSGKKVYLVEKQPSIGGHMAKFDKTFPTLDCAACILTPKMVSVGQHPNIELLGTCGIAAGARDVMRVLMNLLEQRDARDILLTTSGCAGLCSSEPMMTVEVKGQAPVKYVHLDEAKTVQIFESHVLAGKIVPEYALAVGSERVG